MTQTSLEFPLSFFGSVFWVLLSFVFLRGKKSGILSTGRDLLDKSTNQAMFDRER